MWGPDVGVLTLVGHRASIDIREHLSTSGQEETITDVFRAKNTADVVFETATLDNRDVALLHFFPRLDVCVVWAKRPCWGYNGFRRFALIDKANIFD